LHLPSLTPYYVVLSKTAYTCPQIKYTLLCLVFSTLQVGTGRLADHPAARAVGPVYDGQAREAQTPRPRRPTKVGAHQPETLQGRRAEHAQVRSFPGGHREVVHPDTGGCRRHARIRPIVRGRTADHHHGAEQKVEVIEHYT